MRARSKTRLRVASLLSAIALATAIAACGDSNDDTSNDGNAGASANQDGGSSSNANDTSGDNGSAEQPASDEDQIKALLTASQKAFRTGDGKVVCDALTAAGQKDMVDYGSVIGLAGDCAKVAEGVTAYNKKVGLKQPPSKVVAVRVNGQNATAIMRVEGSGAIRQGFKKIDSQWKQLPYGLSALVGTPKN